MAHAGAVDLQWSDFTSKSRKGSTGYDTANYDLRKHLLVGRGSSRLTPFLSHEARPPSRVFVFWNTP